MTTPESMQIYTREDLARAWEDGWNNGVVDEACGCTAGANRTPNPHGGGA